MSPKKQKCQCCYKNELFWSYLCESCLEKFVKIAQLKIEENNIFYTRDFADKQSVKIRKEVFDICKSMSEKINKNNNL